MSKLTKELLADGAFVLGVACVGFGLWTYSPVLAVVFVGGCLICVGLWLGR